MGRSLFGVGIGFIAALGLSFQALAAAPTADQISTFTVDIDGDGVFEQLRADFDYDGDGTEWQYCECGGNKNTTPGFTADYICGTYRTSATDDTPVDYSAGDKAGQPAECRFQGERIWDDITDDMTAAESYLERGATVYFPEGIYVTKGAKPGDTDACWNSKLKDWSQVCADDPYYQGEANVPMSAIVMRKDGLSFRGASMDGNGEKDLKRSGTWIVRNLGLRDDWPNSPLTMPLTFCMGFAQGQSGGSCGVDLWDGASSASVLLTVNSGSCIDIHDTGGPPQTSGDADGLCDSDGSTTRVNSVISNRNEICIDDSAGFATALSTGDLLAVTMVNGAGDNTRIFMRVDSVGAACGSGSEGLTVAMGWNQLLDDLGDTNPHVINLPDQIFGSQSADSGESNHAGIVQGPIDEDRLISGLTVEQMTFAHQNYIGDGVCTDGTQTECDEGSIIAPKTGRGNIFRRNAIVHTNSAWGSGGMIDTGPFQMGFIVEENVFRYNGGASLIDISTGGVIRNNVFEDNASVKLATDRSYLVANQGGFMRFENNVLQRNFVRGYYKESGMLNVNGPFNYVTGNQFLTSDGNCVRINNSSRFDFINGNIFQCGDYTSATSGGQGRAAIYIASNQASEPNEFIDISDNQFLAGGFHTTDSGETAKIILGGDNDTTEGEFGPGGIYIHDNMALIDSATSTFIAFRADDDPDAKYVFINGNMISQGYIVAQMGWSSTSFFTMNGTATDKIGLPYCGVNLIGGVPTQGIDDGAGGAFDQCVSAW